MSKPDLSPIPPTLGNPAQNAGFPHSHRAGDGGPLSHPRAKPAKIEGFYRFSLRTHKQPPKRRPHQKKQKKNTKEDLISQHLPKKNKNPPHKTPPFPPPEKYASPLPEP